MGIAPVGRAKWSVSEKMSETIRRERAQVEGVIGGIKSKKYGFNKPNVKSSVAGDVWPSLVFGLQSVQSFEKIKRATTSNGIMGEDLGI